MFQEYPVKENPPWPKPRREILLLIPPNLLVKRKPYFCGNAFVISQFARPRKTRNIQFDVERIPFSRMRHTLIVRTVYPYRINKK
jgi:hypothetical protein